MPPNGKGGAEAECRGAAGVSEKLCLFCAEPQITAKGLGVCGEAELSCTPRSTFQKLQVLCGEGWQRARGDTGAWAGDDQ